jgi:hypothetical protein
MHQLKNFRDFEAGPDPFGRKWHVLFKYLQTGISIRHSDSVDVRYILSSGDETVARTVVLHNADLRAWSKLSPDNKISDTLCSRIAMCKILRTVETAEDAEKTYLVVTPQELKEIAADVKTWEADAVKKYSAA